MRVFNTCILLFLIVKGTFGFSVGNSAEGQACCDEVLIEVVSHADSDSVDLNTQNEENEPDKGCCDVTCHCLCCIHLFTNLTSPIQNSSLNFLSMETTILYNFDYNRLAHNNIWQPPRLI